MYRSEGEMHFQNMLKIVKTISDTVKTSLLLLLWLCCGFVTPSTSSTLRHPSKFAILQNVYPFVIAISFDLSSGARAHDEEREQVESCAAG